MKDDIQADLLKDYLRDSIEFVDGLEDLLLQLEQMVGQEPDSGLINDILGRLHTFKGNSGMIGFSSLQKYTHKLEDLFKAIQGGKVNLDDSMAEFCLNSSSVLRNALIGISSENPVNPYLDKDIEILEKIISDKNKSSAVQNEPAQEAGIKVIKDSSKQIAQKNNVLKVDFERLDHLLNLMGELVIYRTRLGRIDAQLKETIGEKGLALDLTSTSEQIGKVTTELHEAIMKVRMLPIKQVLMRFPRLVRDLARERGKKIELQFEGEETELDKTVIDEIGEPLLHLIRNAVDHGIESPKDRLAQGKPEQGTILVKIYQESSHIVILVNDDGKGIDKEKVRKKAEKSGLLKNDEIGHNVLDYIFVSGFSTAEKVTEISGRGVGMDVVKKSLAKINGSIEVETEKGIGTSFTIKLPLTLAIVSALMVEVGREQYAIPLASVVESVNVDRRDIHLVNKREVTKIRDSILPLVRLSELFNVEGSVAAQENYVVIVQSAYGRIGIIVDSLLGQQQIVIKGLDDYLGDAEGISGATILGDGRVVLIVDVFELTEKIKKL